MLCTCKYASITVSPEQLVKIQRSPFGDNIFWKTKFRCRYIRIPGKRGKLHILTLCLFILIYVRQVSRILDCYKNPGFGLY